MSAPVTPAPREPYIYSVWANKQTAEDFGPGYRSAEGAIKEWQDLNERFESEERFQIWKHDEEGNVTCATLEVTGTDPRPAFYSVWTSELEAVTFGKDFGHQTWDAAHDELVDLMDKDASQRRYEPWRIWEHDRDGNVRDVTNEHPASKKVDNVQS